MSKLQKERREVSRFYAPDSYLVSKQTNKQIDILFTVVLLLLFTIGKESTYPIKLPSAGRFGRLGYLKPILSFKEHIGVC